MDTARQSQGPFGWPLRIALHLRCALTSRGAQSVGVGLQAVSLRVSPSGGVLGHVMWPLCDRWVCPTDELTLAGRLTDVNCGRYSAPKNTEAVRGTRPRGAQMCARVCLTRARASHARVWGRASDALSVATRCSVRDFWGAGTHRGTIPSGGRACAHDARARGHGGMRAHPSYQIPLQTTTPKHPRPRT
jgi:hypothetical protein